MSKKDRLKAQKEKQDKLKKQAELEEKLEKEEYDKGKKESRSVRKMKKQRGIKDEPAYYLVLKLLMLAGFGYSAFFYGLITIIGITGKYIEPTPPKWVLWFFIVSVMSMTAGLFLTFFKKYFLAFGFNIVGMALYLKGGSYLINKISSYLETHTVEPDLMDMDKTYKWRFYPVILIGVLAAAFLIITIIRLILIRKRQQLIKDTAPVKSIVED